MRRERYFPLSMRVSYSLAACSYNRPSLRICRTRSLPARSLALCENIFYRQKTEAATAIYFFYGTGANKQLSQAQVVQKLYNAIHWINHYPVGSAIGFPDIFPLDSGK